MQRLRELFVDPARRDLGGRRTETTTRRAPRGVRADPSDDRLKEKYENTREFRVAQLAIGIVRNPWSGPRGDTAILDRLLHHAVMLNIRGDSYRLKEKLKVGLVGAQEAEA
jgi:hypothetical protein